MSRQSELDQRNAERLAMWRRRWASRRGSCFLVASPFDDLRDEDQMRHWRTIEFNVARTGLAKKSRAKVVNLSAWYLRRARNGRQKTGGAVA